MKRIYRSACLLATTCALLSLGSSCKKETPQTPALPKIIDEEKKVETKVVDLRLDKSEVELTAKQGESASETLHVTQGNGTYTATSSSETVQVTVEKSELMITATAAAEDYSATITVKDKAGKTATVTVKVVTTKEEPKPGETPTPEKPTPAKPTPETPTPPAPQPEKPKAIDLKLDQTSVTLAALEGQSASATVRITSGNGGYKVESDDDHVTASLAGNGTITVTGRAKANSYTTQVFVSDKEKKTAILQVIVNTTPKPAEPAPTPAPEKPKPVQPAGPEVKLEKQALSLEGAPGDIVEGRIRILQGSANIVVRPYPFGSVNHLADGSGRQYDEILFRMRVDTKKYTEQFLIVDSKTAKGEVVSITVTPKAGANKPGNGNNGGHNDSQKTPDGQFTYGDINKWHASHATVYTFIAGGSDRGTGRSLVASVNGKQIIGVSSGSSTFKITYPGTLAEGTYTGATLTSASKKNGVPCTVVITKNDGTHFWGYFFSEGSFKGRFCDKVKK